MRRRTVQPEIRSFVSVLRSPVTLFDRSKTKNANCFKEQRFWQRKLWTQCPSRGEKLRCTFLARKSAKLFANSKVEMFVKERCKIHRQFQRFGKERCKIPHQFQCYYGDVTSVSHTLSLCISLSPSAPHAQYRKRFRASYNTQFHGVLSSFGAYFSSNSPIILPSLANRRKRKFIESTTQKCRALACLAIVISDIFCAEFDGLIFQFPFLYLIYHDSRYALDIVIFWMSFWGFDFDFCQSYYNTGKSLYPVTL